MLPTGLNLLDTAGVAAVAPRRQHRPARPVGTLAPGLRELEGLFCGKWITRAEWANEQRALMDATAAAYMRAGDSLDANGSLYELRLLRHYNFLTNAQWQELMAELHRACAAAAHSVAAAGAPP